jgi:hypothetical protein
MVGLAYFEVTFVEEEKGFLCTFFLSCSLVVNTPFKREPLALPVVQVMLSMEKNGFAW